MDRDHTPGEIALTGFLMLFAAFAAYGSAYKTFEGWEKGNFTQVVLCIASTAVFSLFVTTYALWFFHEVTDNEV